VLSRISSLLSGRGHNIKSLSVAPTQIAGLSRITITVLATLPETRKVVRQIEGVHEVLAVLQSARVDSVHREVVLLKMSTEYGSIKDKAQRIERGEPGPTHTNRTPNRTSTASTTCNHWIFAMGYL
jgi:acetolactate synthase small subunit